MCHRQPPPAGATAHPMLCQQISHVGKQFPLRSHTAPAPSLATHACARARSGLLDSSLTFLSAQQPFRVRCGTISVSCRCSASHSSAQQADPRLASMQPVDPASHHTPACTRHPSHSTVHLFTLPSMPTTRIPHKQLLYISTRPPVVAKGLQRHSDTAAQKRRRKTVKPQGTA